MHRTSEQPTIVGDGNTIVDKWKGRNITDKLPVVPVGTRKSWQDSKHVVQYCKVNLPI